MSLKPDDIIIIDDFLDNDEMNVILNSILESRNCNWVLSSVSTGGSERYKFDSNVKENIQFVHGIVSDEQNLNSPLNDIIQVLLIKLKQKIDINVERIKRCKINFSFPAIKQESRCYRTPHYDYSNQYNDPSKDIIIGLYYVNDSDGDTILFDGPNILNEDGNLKIKKTISPKKGRMVLFDNTVLHSAQPPLETEYRCVINFNFMKEDYVNKTE